MSVFLRSLLSLFALLFLTASPVLGETRLNLSFHLGSLSPEDSAPTSTFDKDFFLDGSFGIESSSGIEFLARIGHYSNTSDNPEDIGKGLSLNLTPVTASLFYHFWQKAGYSFFAGAGVGAYLYNVTESLQGTLERGASFGESLTLGVRYNFTKTLFVSTKYEKHFVEKIFFPNSANFNNTIFTVGIGFSSSKYGSADRNYQKERNSGISGEKPEPYRYSSTQEALLVEMYQIEREIHRMKKRLVKLSKKFNRERVEESGEEIQILEEILKRAKSYLKDLEIRRFDLGISSLPLAYHYDYLLNFHRVSPYGLRYRSGFFYYGSFPYRGRFLGRHYLNNNASTPEEREEFLRKKREEILRLKKREF